MAFSITLYRWWGWRWQWRWRETWKLMLTMKRPVGWLASAIVSCRGEELNESQMKIKYIWQHFNQSKRNGFNEDECDSLKIVKKKKKTKGRRRRRVFTITIIITSNRWRLLLTRLYLFNLVTILPQTADHFTWCVLPPWLELVINIVEGCSYISGLDDCVIMWFWLEMSMKRRNKEGWQ